MRSPAASYGTVEDMRIRVLVLVFGMGAAACSGPVTTDAGADSADVAADVGGFDGTDTGIDVPMDAPVDARDAADALAEPMACAVECGDFRCAHCSLGCCDMVRDAGTDAPDAPDAIPRSCRDADGDGYSIDPECGALDCDDSDPFIHPGAMQRCNGLDNECDGMVDTTLADAQNTQLDGFCAGAPAVIGRSFTYPPVCHYPGRVLSGYHPMPDGWCEACTPSGGMLLCECWDYDHSWACGSRP